MQKISLKLHLVEVPYEGFLVFAALLKRRKDYRLSVVLRSFFAEIGCLIQVTESLSLRVPIKEPGYLDIAPFSHSVGQEISSAGNQNGRHKAVFPIIIMGNSPQRCLNTADDNRNLREKLF